MGAKRIEKVIIEISRTVQVDARTRVIKNQIVARIIACIC